MSELLTLNATEALAKLHTREVSSLELTEAHLARIEARNPTINAYITVNTEGARTAAKAADAAIAKGEIATLTGLPLGIKDLYCTNGLRTTAASKFLSNFVPAYESTVTKKLWDAGAVNLGKLNMDEFAMGGSGENSAYGPAQNPWGPDTGTTLVPGGSSSGSAAAVADYQCYAATGSDTGGSIRQPASFTGLVGIKPTYGRCSRWGMVAFASSLDQAGFLTRSTEDAALLMEVISGHDPLDSTSSPQPVPAWRANLGNLNLKGLRIGLPKEYFIEGLDPKIRSLIEAAARQFEGEGAIVKQISLPHTQYAPAAYYIVAPAEAASNLARYDGMRYGVRVEGSGGKGGLNETYLASRTAGFGAEVKRRIMIGNYALSSGYYDAYYTKAMQTRTLISQDFDRAFEEVDVIFAPTAPTAAFPIGSKSADPIAMYLGDAFTIPTSLAGLPGLSINAGTVEENGIRLPVGLQLIGPRWNEAVLLQVAFAWEKMAGLTQPPFKS